ncbi:MAG: plasmid partitioning protein RepB [Rhodovulum sulfidophilum]|uniref:Plasmid partitioning protein RepB n=1 Tax=Rhodovulum sulfidophilum TaxID=35806 RepID=A0A2W5Q4K5_RHOSU|nr:MAG: plasmid partitioning protein RepB [Rhodovulum sulfidophilum]
MARKDLLKNVLDPASAEARSDPASRASYAVRGASKQMKVSIDSLAEASRQLREGGVIVEIEPDLIEASFVSDRLGMEDEEFEALKASIAAGQQDTPVLLRPHPKATNRYMVVFGHRRVRAARELGRKVRAIVKPLDDVAHILAQGQENSARANLSFIERARFAQSLSLLGQPRPVIESALSVDPSLLSRMLSVAQGIPEDIVTAIGPAKSIGRDRWDEIKRLLASAEVLTAARTIAGEAEFVAATSDARFELLFSRLSSAVDRGEKGTRKARSSKTSVKRTWTANGGRIKGVIARSGRSCQISLTSQDSAQFGEYLASKLDEIYASFLSESKKGGPS